MDKKQLLEELEKNIKDFKMLDEKQSMLQIALYQKTIEQIKTSYAEVEKTDNIQKCRTAYMEIDLLLQKIKKEASEFKE